MLRQVLVLVVAVTVAQFVLPTEASAEGPWKKLFGRGRDHDKKARAMAAAAQAEIARLGEALSQTEAKANACLEHPTPAPVVCNHTELNDELKALRQATDAKRNELKGFLEMLELAQARAATNASALEKLAGTISDINKRLNVLDNINSRLANILGKLESVEKVSAEMRAGINQTLAKVEGYNTRLNSLQFQINLLNRRVDKVEEVVEKKQDNLIFTIGGQYHWVHGLTNGSGFGLRGEFIVPRGNWAGIFGLDSSYEHQGWSFNLRFLGEVTVTEFGKEKGSRPTTALNLRFGFQTSTYGVVQDSLMIVPAAVAGASVTFYLDRKHKQSARFYVEGGPAVEIFGRVHNATGFFCGGLGFGF